MGKKHFPLKTEEKRSGMSWTPVLSFRSLVAEGLSPGHPRRGPTVGTWLTGHVSSRAAGAIPAAQACGAFAHGLSPAVTGRSPHYNIHGPTRAVSSLRRGGVAPPRGVPQHQGLPQSPPLLPRGRGSVCPASPRAGGRLCLSPALVLVACNLAPPAP